MLAASFFFVKGIVVIESSGKQTYVSKEELDADRKKSLQFIMDHLETSDIVSVISFSLETGKKHQIRFHCREILGCPIFFDFKYGFRFEDIKTSSLIEFAREYPSLIEK